MQTGVTQASLLDAVFRAIKGDPGPDDAMTIPDMARRIIAEQGGGSFEYLIKKLRETIPASGMFEVVWVRRPDRVGRESLVPAYRLVAQEPS